MNKVILIGNLTKDPERRVTRSGVTTCSFTLAVERDHKDKDGKRTVAECIADDVQFLGGPRREAAPQAYEDYDDPFPEE